LATNRIGPEGGSVDELEPLQRQPPAQRAAATTAPADAARISFQDVGPLYKRRVASNVAGRVVQTQWPERPFRPSSVAARGDERPARGPSPACCSSMKRARRRRRKRCPNRWRIRRLKRPPRASARHRPATRRAPNRLPVLLVAQRHQLWRKNLELSSRTQSHLAQRRSRCSPPPLGGRGGRGYLVPREPSAQIASPS
jgi:hypothetical protein